jgi:hypothetical protein
VVTLSKRVSRLRGEVADRGQADRPFLVVWESVDADRTDQRPPGVYRQGSVLDVVYAGEEPDPEVRARVREMMAPAAL